MAQDLRVIVEQSSTSSGPWAELETAIIPAEYLRNFECLMQHQPSADFVRLRVVPYEPPAPTPPPPPPSPVTVRVDTEWIGDKPYLALGVSNASLEDMVDLLVDIQQGANSRGHRKLVVTCSGIGHDLRDALCHLGIPITEVR